MTGQCERKWNEVTSVEDALLFMRAWHALHPPTISTHEAACSNETERMKKSQRFFWNKLAKQLAQIWHAPDYNIL